MRYSMFAGCEHISSFTHERLVIEGSREGAVDPWPDRRRCQARDLKIDKTARSPSPKRLTNGHMSELETTFPPGKPTDNTSTALTLLWAG